MRALIATAAVVTATTAADPRPVVTIPGLGVAQGVYDATCDGVEIFFGLPYAQPPVGSLRWREPQPLAAWPSGTRDASSFGARCMQSDAVPLPNSTMAEDCLFLNVYAPKGAAAATAAGAPADRAVMLWIHGGSYTTGESNDYAGNALVAASNGTSCSAPAPGGKCGSWCADHSLAPDACDCGVCGSFGGCTFTCKAGDGRVACPATPPPAPPPPPPPPAGVPAALAAVLQRPDVVVVTVNYRLNVFGFLGSQHLAAEAGASGTGNYGIADQRAAMAWVKRNIGAFGGDAAAVTIFGESAGGNSVLNHLAQKASFPLYRRAVIESGAYDRGAATMAAAETQFASVQKLAKCQHGGLACLRQLDAATLRDVGVSQGALLPKDRGWGPVVDGVALPKAPLDLIDAGDYNAKAPVLAGTNRDEMAFFLITFQVTRSRLVLSRSYTYSPTNSSTRFHSPFLNL
jgi:carboxylesterase type B